MTNNENKNKNPPVHRSTIPVVQSTVYTLPSFDPPMHWDRMICYSNQIVQYDRYATWHLAFHWHSKNGQLLTMWMDSYLVKELCA